MRGGRGGQVCGWITPESLMQGDRLKDELNRHLPWQLGWAAAFAAVTLEKWCLAQAA